MDKTEIPGIHVPTAVLIDSTTTQEILSEFHFNLDAPPVVGDRIGILKDKTLELYEVVARLHVAETPNTSGPVTIFGADVTQMVLYVNHLGSQPIAQP